MTPRRAASLAVLAITTAAAAVTMNWSLSHGPALEAWAKGTALEIRELYRRGDQEGGRALLDRMAELDPARASYELGRFYRDGLLGRYAPEPDPEAARQAFSAAVAAGASETAGKALLSLALLREADGLPAPELVKLLHEASGLGNRRASTLLAEKLIASGAPQNRSYGLRLLWKAIWSDPEANLYLARLYKSGSESPPSRRAIADLARRAELLLETDAREGSVGAMLRLGHFLSEDDLDQQDLAKALAWFRHAADAGSLKGMIAAADLMLGDDEELRAVPLGLGLLESASRAGSAEAAFKLGKLYAEGVLVPLDETLAHDWLEKAAAMGSEGAMVALARPLIAQDVESAEFRRGQLLLEHASRLGSAPAALLLGQTVEAGRLDAFQTGRTAYDWYELAARRGSGTAMVRLVMAHRTGDIAAVDPRKELSWTKTAVESGVRKTSLLLRLAAAYLDGKQGLPRDLRAAARWYEVAAQRGSTTAMIRMAEAYVTGGGVPVDPEQAVLWYRRAAEKGSVKAIDGLARAYASGFGVPLDPVEAYRLFLRAAVAGSGSALRETGRAFAIGFGVEPDPARAVQFFNAAASAGDTSAMLELIDAYRQGIGVAPDERRAMEWLQRAAALADKNAQFLLARAYLDGDGVAADRTRAIDLLEAAMRQGSGDAERLLADLKKGAGG